MLQHVPPHDSGSSSTQKVVCYCSVAGQTCGVRVCMVVSNRLSKARLVLDSFALTRFCDVIVSSTRLSHQIKVTNVKELLSVSYESKETP